MNNDRTIAMLNELKEFCKRGENLKARSLGLSAEAETLDKEFAEWIKNNLGLTGQHHVSDIVMKTVEASIAKQIN